MIALLDDDDDDDDDADLSGRAELLARAGQLISTVGAARWRRTEAELALRERWNALPDDERARWEERAAEEEARRQKLKADRARAAEEGAPPKKKAKAEAGGGEKAGAKRKTPPGGGGEVATGAPKWALAKNAGAGIQEVPCPELGAGWKRRSKPRGAGAGAHTDHFYLSPDGKSVYNSLKKAREALGLDTRALSSAELARKEQRDREKERKVAAKQREKDAKAQAKERLQQALKRSKEEEERRSGVEKALANAPTGECPEPPGRLRLSDPSHAQDVIGAWAHATAFQALLNLRPYYADDLAAALQRPGESPLLAETCVRLLQGVLYDVEALRKRQLPPRADLLIQQVPDRLCVTAANWPEVLRCTCWLVPELHATEAVRAALDALHGASIQDVSPSHKLALLRLLGDAYCSTEAVQKALRDNVDKQKELHAEKKLKDKEILDKWRERQREMQARERPDGAAASAAEKSEKKEANPPAESELDDSGDEGGGGGGGKGKATLDDAQRAAREAKKERLKKKKAATKALLGAIEKRELRALEDAIEQAAAAGHQGTVPDGRSWRTDELKAAQKLLPALRESYAFEQEGAQLRRRQIDNARKHRQMGSYPVRDEALGKDRRGRRYWAFSADPARLWVESPANDAAPWEYEGGTWYFYDTVELVKAMADSLDGADAESGEKELKKVWDASRTGQQWRTRTAHHLTPSSLARRCARRCRCSRRTWPRRRCRTHPRWRDEGHEYIGQPVLRSFKEQGVETWSTGKITRSLRRPKKSPRRCSMSYTTTTATRRISIRPRRMRRGRNTMRRRRGASRRSPRCRRSPSTRTPTSISEGSHLRVVARRRRRARRPPRARGGVAECAQPQVGRRRAVDVAALCAQLGERRGARRARSLARGSGEGAADCGGRGARAEAVADQRQRVHREAGAALLRRLRRERRHDRRLAAGRGRRRGALAHGAW